MSYDVTLTCDKCSSVMCDLNMTSNVAPMWRTAGLDLREHHGESASTLLPTLQVAIDAMLEDPDRYRAMNPGNGWGNYEGTLRFLQELRDAACRNPDALYEVSY